MTPRDFTVWLQGYLEAVGTKDLSQEDTQKIKDKLNSIFVHEAENVDPVNKNIKDRFIHQTPGTHVSAEGKETEAMVTGKPRGIGHGTIC